MLIYTVGELRQLLKYSDDEEPLTCKLNDKTINCVGASSAAGGRTTLLWFESTTPSQPIEKVPVITNNDLLEEMKKANEKLLQQMKEIRAEPYKPCTVHVNCGGGCYCNDNGIKRD